MSRAFSIVVIGDTQYLFDGDRVDPSMLRSTVDEVARLVSSGALAPVRHIVHVGDVTEHGWDRECELALPVLADCQAALGSPAMTIATGNHDVAHHSSDDRGDTAFLTAFGPGSPLLDGAHLRSPVVHAPGGYSSWRVITLPDGGTLGVLALDWRPTGPTWDWAEGLLAEHAALPTIVVTHEAALNHRLTPHGRRIAARLADHPQVFLVLAGHEWPSTRVVDDDREYHAVNHQHLPFGGGGAVRVYEFDPDKGSCQAITLTAALRDPRALRSVEARRLLALASADDQFRFPLPPSLRRGSSTPWQAAGLELVADIVPDGVVEFDAVAEGASVLEARCRLPRAMQSEWQVLVARLGPAPGDSPEPLAALSLSSENFIGWQAFVDQDEAWATSHEYPPSAEVTIVVRHGEGGGLWIDNDIVGRVDGRLSQPLCPGPWRWRIGLGEYDGAPADPFQGSIERVRVWTEKVR